MSSEAANYFHDQERSRKWIFTCRYNSGIYTTPSGIVYIGPTETTNGVQHNHGLYVSIGQSQHSGNPLRKKTVVDQLKTFGISPTYVAALKDVAGYIRYMNKKGTTPPQLIAEMKATKGQGTMSSHYEELALKAAANFNSKPSMNAFKEALFKLDFNYPEQLAKRAYQTMTFAKETKLDRVFKKMKTQPKQWTPNEAATIVMDIINSSTDQGWDDEDLMRLYNVQSP